MNTNDQALFFKTLAGCCEAVGRPPLSTAGAELMFVSLDKYPLDWVMWGMVHAAKVAEDGFDFNLALIIKTIETEMHKNAFRENAERLLANQQHDKEAREKYLASDEFKRNQAGGKDCIEKLKGLLG